jgi:uncharacterized membrane protein (UPF0127 family)
LTVASSFWARLRGLIGRASPAPGEGLLLTGANSIHMLFMGYPIDVAFLGPAASDGMRKIVDVRHSLPPWRGVVWYVRGATDAAELKAGALAAAGVRVGMSVRLTSAQAD